MIPLFNIFILAVFVILIYAIIGLELFCGVMHSRCEYKVEKSLNDVKYHPWFNVKPCSPFVRIDNSYGKKEKIWKVLAEYGFSIEFIETSMALREINHGTACYKILDLSLE